MLKKILIVGLGSIGKRHARLVRRLLPEAQIAVLRHNNCKQLPDIDHCYTNLDEAIQFQPQAAVIANPASFHLDVAVKLAEAGVHLLVEKPISNSTRGVTELLNVCRNQNVILMTGYNMRFLPALRKFRELLKKNIVGRVLSVRSEVGQYLPSWRPGSDYRCGVSANSKLGGGVLLELSHEIDYLQWIFGDVEWVKAVLVKQSDLDIDVEDTAHLILGFKAENGSIPVVANLNMDFIRHDTCRSCTVIGDTGTIRWNAMTGILELFTQGDTSWQIIYSHPSQSDESYLSEWSHFLECISNKRSPEISGYDGLVTLRVIEAAVHSSVAETSVTINNTSKDEQYLY